MLCFNVLCRCSDVKNEMSTRLSRQERVGQQVETMMRHGTSLSYMYVAVVLCMSDVLLELVFTLNANIL